MSNKAQKQIEVPSLTFNEERLDLFDLNDQINWYKLKFVLIDYVENYIRMHELESYIAFMIVLFNPFEGLNNIDDVINVLEEESERGRYYRFFIERDSFNFYKNKKNVIEKFKEIIIEKDFAKELILSENLLKEEDYGPLDTSNISYGLTE